MRPPGGGGGCYAPRVTFAAALLGLWACGAAPPEWAAVAPVVRRVPAAAESDAPFGGDGRWVAGPREATLADRALLVDGAPVAEALIAAPAAGGATLAWADEDGGEEKVAALGPEGVRVLARGVRADRLAVSPDGAQVVWVAPVEGLAGLWIAPADGSAPPRPLTNAGLPRARAGPPAGWTAPPRTAPRFDGDRLAWDGGEVAWR